MPEEYEVNSLNKQLTPKRYLKKIGTAFVGGDFTGNARGANALDIQSSRSAVTQVASGANSSAIGYRNTASGEESSAIGYSNTASGVVSSAIGYDNTASGYYYSSAIGYGNTASGVASSAIGYDNIVSGYYSSAIGYRNTASGISSSAIGYDNIASGNYSSAIGYENTASGYYSSAIGYSNTASGGSSSSAFGYQNAASGNYSSAFGYQNTASGYYSSAIGYSNTASGVVSSAIGSFANSSIYGEIALNNSNTATSEQISKFVLRKTTTNATQTTLSLSEGTQNLVLPSDTHLGFTCKVMGVSSAGVTNMYTFRGFIKNVGGTTTLSTTVVKEEFEEDTDWDATIEANDTTDSMDIKVTGEVATTIKWAATLDCVKIDNS